MLDRDATVQNAKKFLMEYHDWKIEAARFSLSLQSPVISDMPSAPSHGNTQENTIVGKANAQFECSVRLNTIHLLGSIDDDNALLADLLEYRFINGWRVKKVCERLAEKYGLGYLAERTYNDYQNKALWTFAIVCPISSVRVKKVRR
ncbi:hypothetical protein IWT25_02170 [Secundilactobacillus pentosiphilus]|uniref:Uncharacterized protein n=1 Tax=Secundilactobacillus pentosiphilus TaxID=1714682 RepID=A0A1Z5IYG6_9LACO|nr:hypothetical protein [Secundilactobacillus pentosiphilus]GAX06823.1 hypothetical protein IWT25_02170 [Secundilactobacillus pentosiphilus]